MISLKSVQGTARSKIEQFQASRTVTNQDLREEGQLSIVGDPGMIHDCYEAHSAFWIFV